MNIWTYEMRRKERGLQCLLDQGPDCPRGGLCGCGNRTPPPKGKKTRIVKRAVARTTRVIVSEDLP